MATGIVTTFSGAVTVTYTPANNAKVLINALGGSVQVNGVGISAGSTSGSVIEPAFFVGAGQTITITSSSGVSGVVSSLEES